MRASSVCATLLVRVYPMDVGCRLVIIIISNNNDIRKTRKFIHIKSVDNYNFIAMQPAGRIRIRARGSKKGESESGRQIISEWMRESANVNGCVRKNRGCDCHIQCEAKYFTTQTQTNWYFF